MQSANDHINQLHQVYCNETGCELPLLPASERWWFDAIKAGMTANDIVIVVKDRKNRIFAKVRHQESLYLRNFIGSDEAIQSVMEEAAAIRALKRRAQYPKGKQQVLKATGRTSEPDLKACRTIGDVLKSMKDL